MIARAPSRRLITVVAIAIGLVSANARADDAPVWSMGITPSLGGGVAALTNARPLRSFIGYTTLGVELRYETGAWGGFVRGEYYSSGDGGLWTAPALLLGASRRLVGSGIHEVGVVPYVALDFARWHASDNGCPVAFILPSGCTSEAPPVMSSVRMTTAPVFDATTNTLGIDVGARIELPTPVVYVAFDGDLSANAPLTSTGPGAVLQARIALVLAFHDTRTNFDTTTPDDNERRFRRF